MLPDTRQETLPTSETAGPDDPVMACRPTESAGLTVRLARLEADIAGSAGIDRRAHCRAGRLDLVASRHVAAAGGAPKAPPGRSGIAR